MIDSPNVWYPVKDSSHLCKITTKVTMFNSCNNMLLKKAVSSKTHHFSSTAQRVQISAFRVTHYLDLKLKLVVSKNVCTNNEAPIIVQPPYIYFTPNLSSPPLAIYTSNSKLVPLSSKKEWPTCPIFHSIPLLAISINRLLPQQPILSLDMWWINLKNLRSPLSKSLEIPHLVSATQQPTKGLEPPCLGSSRTWSIFNEPMTSWSTSQVGSRWNWLNATKSCTYLSPILPELTWREQRLFPFENIASHHPFGRNDALLFHLLNCPLTFINRFCTTYTSTLGGDSRDLKKEKNTMFFFL